MIQEGPGLARRQLLDLVEVSDGAVELLRDWESKAGHVFEISLDTSGISRRPEGVVVRSRERFKVVVNEGFPYEHPSVWAAHKRWAGKPHVQWGSYLCLYAAPSVEWAPSDGIRGLVARLCEWIEHAANGSLDPDGQPLHPPAVYSASTHGSVLIHPDVGDRAPWTEQGNTALPHRMVAWCAVDNRRVDVLEWMDAETAVKRTQDHDTAVFDRGRPLIALPVVLSPNEFGFEFPRHVKPLSEGLAASGYDKDVLLRDLAWATAINRLLRARQVSMDPAAAGDPWDEASDPDSPLFTAMIVGTPSRRVEGHTRLAHLATWKVDAFSQRVADLFSQVLELREAGDLEDDVRDLAYDWFEKASISWMQVMELRPEVTQRRDKGTPVGWLTGKRVLVLGCGALGAPIAEYCARAGVSKLTVADKGVVTPGILVRQPYMDSDIGTPKAEALAHRLSMISPLDVHPVVGNVRTTLFSPDSVEDPTEFDLIVDASADAAVRAVVERWSMRATKRLPLVTMVIGHDAQRGLVTTNLREATGAGADSFRKVALRASSGYQEWRDVREDFFPPTPRTELFFPEPGCSAPTFVGSAAQTAALAGLMLNEALLALGGGSPTSEKELVQATSFASVVRLGAAATLGTSRLAWPSDVVLTDASSGFHVRMSAPALAEVRSEVRRGARVRGEQIETGGMLFGSFDDATGVVYVDSVAGPPPDSYLAEKYFQHGLQGVQERVDAEMKRSSNSSGFVGFWHTHPGGTAYPSETDWQGMEAIVGPDGTRKRALMMIFGGSNERWESWRNEVSVDTPDTFVRVIPRTSGGHMNHPGYIGGLDLQMLPPGTYFRGGYSDGVRELHGTGENFTRRTRRFWLNPFGGHRA